MRLRGSWPSSSSSGSEEIAREGKGSDWVYTGWYVEMMHLTYPDAFPYAFADYVPPGDVLYANRGRHLTLPLPPRGGISLIGRVARAPN